MKKLIIFLDRKIPYMTANGFYLGRSMKVWKSAAVLAIALLPGLVSPAQARPRDEVMSSAFRCGVIAEGRRWLDCIYGSAQPVRAALGLPAVTQTQAQLVAAPPAGGPITDQSLRDTVLSAAIRCDAIVADRQWLDCYYVSTTTMRRALGLSPDAQSSRGLQSSGTIRPDMGRDGRPEGDQFGLLQRPRTSSGTVSRLATYTFDRYGIFTVTLANGQVWRQVTGDTTYAHWNQAASTYVVTIKRGALGSYNMRVKDGPGLFKVERVS